MATTTSTSADGTALLKFALSECKSFFGLLSKAVETSIEKGEEPITVFSKKQTAGGPKADKVKRKPSAFNIYMQKKCEQMRAAGTSGASSLENNTLFGQAAAAWKELSEEQRKQYMLLYAENSEDPKLDQLPVPASQSKASIKAETAAEKAKKRKKDTADKPASPTAGAPTGDADAQKKKKKKKKSVAGVEAA